ncbi:MAG: protein kinase [Deltaproteobacteria bacterium]|nr:protein kinase [Deltaproteobacteria bacterium]
MDYPQRFGPYVLERFLAAGGMAEVFVASRPDGRVPGPIALKRMLPQMMENPEYATMFRDEAHLAGQLVHPNVVRVWDSGEYDGRLYMAMELVDGLDTSSLQKKLRAKNEMLGVAHALRIGVELCNGLAVAHALKDERGVAMMIIHRDVSPQNILIARDGTVKVTDFGVAKATGRETHTATGHIKGKIPYMAPEQALAQAIDQRVDQFAAGIVVWELLTATRLFHDKNDLLMFEKIIRRPTPKPSTVRAGIPAAVDAAVLRALAKNPDERFPDVAAFGRALQGALAQVGGWEASELAPIVDYVMPPAAPSSSPSSLSGSIRPALGSEGSRSGPQSTASASNKTPRSQASRPTGQPISAATLDDDDAATEFVPQPAAPPMRTSTPGTPQARPRGLSSADMQAPAPVPSPQSSPALTLDRTKSRAPSGVESAGGPAIQQPLQMMAPPSSSSPVAFPVVFVAVALVLGGLAGFGIAKATAPKVEAVNATGCARPSAATADVEAAYDLLLQSQLNLEAGDLVKAVAKANEAQMRSGTAKGHYMLGRIRMKGGDVSSGLNHYRCVFELAPMSDEAKKISLAVSKS